MVLKPTIIVDDHISECDHCHHIIPIEIQKKLYSYQEVETPVVIQLDVIQHNVFIADGPNCKSTVSTNKKNKGTIYGNNMRSFVSLLYEIGRTPLSGISQIIESFLKQKFSESMIHKALLANAKVLDKVVKEIKREVQVFPVIYVDETSYTMIINMRELGWIRVYATKDAVYFDFADTRGKKEFVRNIHQSLSSLFDDIQKTLPTKNPEGIKKQALVRINEILDLRSNDAQINSFLGKLKKAKHDLLTAIDHDNVDLTNNLAERLLRDIVLHRKIRRFVASENGKMILVNHVTAFQTWKMKKMNPYEEMLELLENYDDSAAA